MKYLIFIFLFSAFGSRAQDTIRLSCSQDQAIKALTEKGFALEMKLYGKLITKPFETKRFGVAGHNELLLRITILNDKLDCKITGEYVNRNTYYHSGGKGWVPIYDKKANAKTWGILNNFALYLKDEISSR